MQPEGDVTTTVAGPTGPGGVVMKMFTAVNVVIVAFVPVPRTEVATLRPRRRNRCHRVHQQHSEHGQRNQQSGRQGKAPSAVPNC